jgi:hypothetical protein
MYNFALFAQKAADGVRRNITTLWLWNLDFIQKTSVEIVDVFFKIIITSRVAWYYLEIRGNYRKQKFWYEKKMNYKYPRCLIKCLWMKQNLKFCFNWANLFQLNKGQVPCPLCQTAALQTNETWTRDISLPKSWPQNNKRFRFHSY